MPRYFIEVSYRGTDYSGFQVQQNAVTIQSEVEKALKIYYRQHFTLTGSSRTDAGVHALQNYFHFDIDIAFEENSIEVYNLNAILPKDIVIKRIFLVERNTHCRFDAIKREYKYFIYQNKNPFLLDRAYYFPYSLDINKLNEAAESLLQHKDFTSFSKKNTQVKTFNCNIFKSEWIVQNNLTVYRVEANRFLRGMVRGLVGTMLKVGTGKISVAGFCDIIESKDCTKADFSVPACGLFLLEVRYNF
jgi:tRNA pseudouridine38-40 synthase